MYGFSGSPLTRPGRPRSHELPHSVGGSYRANRADTKNHGRVHDRATACHPEVWWETRSRMKPSVSSTRADATFHSKRARNSRQGERDPDHSVTARAASWRCVLKVRPPRQQRAPQRSLLQIRGRMCHRLVADGDGKAVPARGDMASRNERRTRGVRRGNPSRELGDVAVVGVADDGLRVRVRPGAYVTVLQRQPHRGIVCQPLMTPTVLIVPGWGDSGPGHWQTLWQTAHPGFRRVKQRDWEYAVRAVWVDALADAVREVAGPVGSSRTAWAVTRWSTWSTRPAHPGALLVAPRRGADRLSPGDRGLRALRASAAFTSSWWRARRHVQ